MLRKRTEVTISSMKILFLQAQSFFFDGVYSETQSFKLYQHLSLYLSKDRLRSIRQAPITELPTVSWRALPVGVLQEARELGNLNGSLRSYKS